jgi:hypothetical protein
MKIYQTKVIDGNPLAKAETRKRQLSAQAGIALHNDT